jgi:hypothetical protein
MPLQNRGTPFGEIVAVPERGSFMGNRGRIHNARRELEANGASLQGKSATMANMDAVLHSERIARDGTQRRWEARAFELPDSAPTGSIIFCGSQRAEGVA